MTVIDFMTLITLLLQIESPRKSITTVGSTPDREAPPPTEHDLTPPIEEQDGDDEIVKTKELPLASVQQQFQFDVGSPMSLKEFQERAL